MYKRQLFTLLVLSGSHDKAISAVLLAALIAFVVFMCIKKVRRDKTLPFAALSAEVAVLLLMSKDVYKRQSYSRVLCWQTVRRALKLECFRVFVQDSALLRLLREPPLNRLP